jgi:hypothetical protein
MVISTCIGRKQIVSRRREGANDPPCPLPKKVGVAESLSQRRQEGKGKGWFLE